MNRDERDLRINELNELVDELEKSVAKYTPMNRDFAFAHPLPKIMRLLVQAIAELQADSPLPSTTKEVDSSILGHPGENLKRGSGLID